MVQEPERGCGDGHGGMQWGHTGDVWGSGIMNSFRDPGEPLWLCGSLACD